MYIYLYKCTLRRKMYLKLRNNLSKNISIILSLGFVSAGGFGATDKISKGNFDSLTDDLLGVAPTVSRYVLPTFDDGEPENKDGYRVAISFSGAAFRFPYHFGVAAYLQETYDLEKVCFIGASAGAMTSALLACEEDIAGKVIGTKVKPDGCLKITNNDSWLDRVYRRLDHKLTGVYFNIFDTMAKVKPSILEDCCKASGRATFSLTNISSWWPKNERVNQFSTRKDLVDYGFASAHIPYLVDGEFSTKVNGQKYIDGGFTDNQPTFSHIPTIEVHPYMDSIWGSTALSWLSLYGTTSMERNRNIYRDGYLYAKSEGDKHSSGLWAPLEAFRKS